MENNYDKEGLSFLLSSDLAVVDGLYLIDSVRRKKHDVADAIRKYGSSEAEKYLNHIHLFSYSDDVGIQRDLAFRIIDAFREKLRLIAPDLFLVGEIKDDAHDIEVTFSVQGSTRVPR